MSIFTIEIRDQQFVRCGKDSCCSEVYRRVLSLVALYFGPSNQLYIFSALVARFFQGCLGVRRGQASVKWRSLYISPAFNFLSFSILCLQCVLSTLYGIVAHRVLFHLKCFVIDACSSVDLLVSLFVVWAAKRLTVEMQQVGTVPNFKHLPQLVYTTWRSQLFLLPLAARQMGGSETSHTSSNAGGHPKGFGHLFVSIDREKLYPHVQMGLLMPCQI